MPLMFGATPSKLLVSSNRKNTSTWSVTAAGGKVIETGKTAQSGGTPSVMLTLVGDTV